MQLETEISSQRQFLDAVLENLTEGVVVCDAQGAITYANNASREVIGLPPAPFGEDEIAERFDIYHADGETRMPWEDTPLLRALRGEVLKDAEVVVAPRDGMRRHLLCSGRAMHSEGGATLGAVVAFHDVTERISAEEASRRRQHLVRQIVENSPDRIEILDLDGSVAYRNPAGARLLKYQVADDPSGREWPELWDEASRRAAGAAFVAACDGRVTRFEGRGGNEPGVSRVWDVVVNPITDKQGRVERILVVSRDTTEQQRTQEALEQTRDQLLQSQKLEALGRLAGGVAHDFNNMLAVVIGFSDLLLMRTDLPAAARGPVTEIQKAGERAARLTQQLLTFSRKEIIAPRQIDLVQGVRDMQQMLRSLISEDIELITLADSGPVPVIIDPSHLEQIIVNLAVNARDSMPRGGKLTLEMRAVQLDEGYADRHCNLPPGLYASLSVSDTGCGMDAETQSRIFEPFFTTKKVGEGTGLGLATVYGVVEQAGGHIWVYSEPDHGTVFKMYFPLDRELVAETRSHGAAPAMQQGSGTVLLTEDEELVRDTVRSILEHAGFTVLPTDLPQEALRICREHPGPIDLLLTDVVMPQMNGRELAEAAAALRPDMKILFMSGYTDDTVLRHGILSAQTAFIEKPFGAQRLISKIQEVLTS